MAPELRQQLVKIFDIARELPAADRASYLDRECAGKPDLRRQIETLLAYDHTHDDFLKRPVWEDMAAETDASDFEGAHPDAGQQALLGEEVPGHAFQAQAMPLRSLPGSVLDQKYRIERQLGKGGMGAVFQATHLGTMRTVALKMIVPQLAEHAEFWQRFKREAEATGRLHHINVVNVTDFGVAKVHDNRVAYLVMEYLDGQTLDSYLRSEPRPSFDFIMDVIEQVALALDAAHAVGVVHRDLKPANIWLEPNHRGGYNVKVLDFGIAKLAGGGDPVDIAPATITRADLQVPTLLAAPSSVMTVAGTLLGTPAYMAPEQCQRLAVDWRADIYSLSVITYEMLCGRLPFQSDDFTRLVSMQISQAPTPPHERDASVSRAVSRIVLKGLEKDPANRPPSAGAFATTLRAVAEGELTLLRRSKDVFHTWTKLFLPLLGICMLPAVAALFLLRLAGHAALVAKLAPVWVLIGGTALAVVAVVVFGLQLYKAACLLVLENALQVLPVRLALQFVLSLLVRGLPVILLTQLRSTLDIRPSAFRDNLLWPVVWATEHCSGVQAINRSRELCRVLPGASTALMIRQYAPPFIGLMFIPAMMRLIPRASISVQDVFRESVSGAGPGWLVFGYAVVFSIFYVNIGSAFSFLYWTARRCRGESIEVPRPASSSATSRRSSSSALRPATVLWAALPMALLLSIIFGRSNSKETAWAIEMALNDGRSAAVLKSLNNGVPVDLITSRGETLLFGAVRQGNRDLVEGLLARGANVNARGDSGSTPLWVATRFARGDIARLLLDHGAAPNATTDDGNTALMTAATRGDRPMVELLLARGAKAELSDAYHKTALSYAMAEGHSDIASLLQKGSH